MALNVYIEEILAGIVIKVSEKLGFPVYYMHGSLKEINARLAMLSQSGSGQAEKFPLVALLHDYTRSRGDAFETVNATILIANNTLATYISDERLEKNFKPVLDPIYLALLDEFNISPYFNTRSALLISHTKIDHYFYGTEAGTTGHVVNRFNDLVDCIELRDLELVLYTKNCLQHGYFKHAPMRERH